MAQITLARAAEVLDEYGLLRTSVSSDVRTFDHMTYASNEVTDSTLLVCKGAFKDDYMRDAVSRGVQWYVSDHEFSADVPAV